eukprot:1058569-Prorocentrum_minimum.AAC.1
MTEVVKLAPPKYRLFTIQRTRIGKRAASEIPDSWIEPIRRRQVEQDQVVKLLRETQQERDLLRSKLDVALDGLRILEDRDRAVADLYDDETGPTRGTLRTPGGARAVTLPSPTQVPEPRPAAAAEREPVAEPEQVTTGFRCGAVRCDERCDARRSDARDVREIAR